MDIKNVAAKAHALIAKYMVIFILMSNNKTEIHESKAGVQLVSHKEDFQRIENVKKKSILIPVSRFPQY